MMLLVKMKLNIMIIRWLLNVLKKDIFKILPKVMMKKQKHIIRPYI